MPFKPPADDVKLYFFGAPLIQRSGSYVSVDRQKAIALLAYLLLTGHKHRRDVLANLLWPDLDQARARAGLRRVLRTLRAAIGSEPVVADNETVGLRVRDSLWADVTDFQQRLANVRVYGAAGGLDPTGQLLLEEAVALYRADLLAGFNLRDAPDFENWLCIEREALRRAVTSALEMLVRLHTAGGSYAQALDFAQRWLALDPAEERAHQALIELYLRSGDLPAARRQYEVCASVLAEEIGVPPSVETQLLIAAVAAEPALHGALLPAPVPAGAPDGTGPPALPLGEVRLATVLVTGLGLAEEVEPGDLMGAEELIERQEQGMQVIRGVLSRYGAYVPLFLGDKAVAIFGLPASHEDDPERAVRAALDLQHCTTGGLGVATGIHTGMVYLQGRAAGLPTGLQRGAVQEMVVLGSAVDMALRLYAAANAGETLVTGSTQRLTVGAVDYATRQVKLPGTRTPATVFAPAGMLAITRKVRGVPGLAAPLVGRDHEVAELLAATRRMMADQAGCLIEIAGAPGVGKSRLVAELHDRLLVEDAANVTWLEGRCAERTNDTAYGPFREIMRGFVRFAAGSDDSDEARVQQLAAQLNTLWQQAGLPQTQLGEITPFLGNLLSLPGQWGDVAIGALAAEEIHYRTVAAIAAFAGALARSKPTVLVLEDLHWADPHSFVVVQQLAAGLGAFPLALVCVTRPEAPTVRALDTATRLCPRHMLAIHLAELSPEESRQLVAQLLSLTPLQAAPDLAGVTALVLERAEGNPLFVEETLRALIDAGALVMRDGAWAVDKARLQLVTGGTLGHVPEAVQSVLLSRFDSQPPHVRQALQIAAVIGRDVPLVLYSRLLPAGTDAAALLPALEEAGFLLADPAHPHTQLIFRHVLQQAVAYQAIGKATRRALHGRVAQAIATAWPAQEEEHVEQLAYHYSRSDDLPKAVEYLARAGAKAQQHFLNAAAMTAYEKALVLLAELPGGETSPAERAGLLAKLGRVQQTVGSFTAAAQSLQHAWDEGTAAGVPAAELARWAYWLADAYYWAGDYPSVLAICDDAFAALPVVPGSQEAIMLNQQRAGAYAALGDAERFVIISLQSAESIRRLPFAEELVSPYHHVIDACLARKEVHRAWEFIDTLQTQAKAAGNLRALAKAEFIAARTCSETGRHAEALARGETALDLARQTGDTATIQFCLSRLMCDAMVLGRLDEARRYADLEHGYAVESGDFGGEWLMVIASIHLGLGEPATARTLLEKSFALARKLDYTLCAEANLWLGRAQRQLGNATAAIGEFHAVLQHSSPSTPSPPFMPDAKPGFLLALAALNELLPDPQQFAAKVDPISAELWGDEPLFRYAYLVPTGVPADETPLAMGDLARTEWQWVDPYGDCSWSHQDGTVEIRAANGRDLWWTNVSAPRLVRRFEGDLSLQAECGSPGDLAPALGGLLIWVDAHNYLRLDCGSGGPHEIGFMGCVNGKSAVIGRGRLLAKSAVLRLTRAGSQVTAWCSAGAGGWYTIGTADFAACAVSAGFYAAGLIDRTIYPCAYPRGTCIRFSELQVCVGESLTPRAAAM